MGKGERREGKGRGEGRVEKSIPTCASIHTYLKLLKLLKVLEVT